MGLPVPLNWLKGSLAVDASTIWGATIFSYDHESLVRINANTAEKIHTIVDTSLQKVWQQLGSYINFSLMDDSRDAIFEPEEVGFYFNEDEDGVQMPSGAGLMGKDSAKEAKSWWDMVYGTTPIPWKYIYPETEDKYSGKDRWMTYKLIFKGWDTMRPTIWGYDDDEAGYRIDWLSYSGMFEDEESNEHIGNLLGHTKLANFLDGWTWHEEILMSDTMSGKMKHKKRIIPTNAEIYDEWLVYNWSSDIDYVVFLWKQT